MLIDDRVAAHDLSLLSYVESETSEEDRRSWLALHAALGEELGMFSYLEIGSHLGGTLQAFLADPRCVRLTSIDPRPAAQPDDRGRWYEYPGNTTERMLRGLAAVPGADMTKLHTIEAGTEDVAPEALPRPDLCLIDAEHTFQAALRDARFCRAACRGQGVIVFHDHSVVEPAIRCFVAETQGRCHAYPLRTNFFVVELDKRASLLRHARVRRRLARPPAAWRLANRMRLARSAVPAAAAARRLRRSLGV